MTPQAVIIGGGIVGCYTAYVLARRGVNTVLVERDGISAHASGANPGGLNPLHGAGIPGPMQDFALRCFSLHSGDWSEIAHLSGMKVDYRSRERVTVAMDAKELAALESAMLQHRNTTGFSARMVEGDELFGMEPRINPAAIRGLVTQGHASIDARRYTTAVAEAAQRFGAGLRIATVQSLKTRRGRVSAVVTSQGVIDCDHLVVATGAWASEASSWLGVALPVRPVKGDLIHARVEGRPFAQDFVCGGAALYGSDGADVMLGGTEEDAGFDEQPGETSRQEILTGVNRLMPGLGEIQIERQTAGLRPTTPDHLPIVGRAPGWSNVLLALGGGRKGMLYSSGMAQAMAEFVIDGATSIDLEVCRPGRFSSMSDDLRRTRARA